MYTRLQNGIKHFASVCTKNERIYIIYNKDLKKCVPNNEKSFKPLKIVAVH